MPTITFDKFDIGIDHRKGASVSDANRLRVLKNGYVTTGKVIKKRSGLTKVIDFSQPSVNEPGTKGLVSGAHPSTGEPVMHTFIDYAQPTTAHGDSRFFCNRLTWTATPTGEPLGNNVERVFQGETYNGYIYVSVRYQNTGTVTHHYINGAHPTKVTDVNCPNSNTFAKQDDRIWAENYESVRYTDPTLAVGSGKDWSDGSGNPYFIGVGSKASFSTKATGLGQYASRLAVFFSDSMQLWDLDIGTSDAFYKNVPGVGTKWPLTIKEFAGDILFLSAAGFRSVTTQAYTQNVYDVDVGSPIDELVRPDITDSLDAQSEYFTPLGQYWCLYPDPADPSKTKVWVYTFSRTVKISAWSQYSFDFIINDICLHEGTVYLRSGEIIYKIDDTVFSDDGAQIDFQMELPFLDFQKPGRLKYIWGFDAVIDGSVNVQFRYDPNDESKITDPITITGDTRPGNIIPIEITTDSIAPVFTDLSGNEVQINEFTFHYDVLGVY